MIKRVGVLRNDGKAIFGRVGPDSIICGPFETQLPDVIGVRKQVGEAEDEVVRDGLVEEELHAAGTVTR